MGVRIHPRERIVAAAKLKIMTLMNEILEEYDITSVEYLQILQELESTELKLMLREERHPDNPEQPAGFE